MSWAQVEPPHSPAFVGLRTSKAKKKKDGTPSSPLSLSLSVYLSLSVSVSLSLYGKDCCLLSGWFLLCCEQSLSLSFSLSQRSLGVLVISLGVVRLTSLLDFFGPLRRLCVCVCARARCGVCCLCTAVSVKCVLLCSLTCGLLCVPTAVCAVMLCMLLCVLLLICVLLLVSSCFASCCVLLFTRPPLLCQSFLRMSFEASDGTSRSLFSPFQWEDQN